MPGVAYRHPALSDSEISVGTAQFDYVMVAPPTRRE
jgi:hypothetical protein